MSRLKHTIDLDSDSSPLTPAPTPATDTGGTVVEIEQRKRVLEEKLRATEKEYKKNLMEKNAAWRATKMKYNFLNQKPSVLVREWIGLADLKMSGVGEFRWENGKEITTSRTITALLNEYTDAFYTESANSKGLRKYSREELRSVMEQALEEFPDRFKAELSESIKFDGSKNSALVELLEKGLLGRAATELEIACLTHWLWGVKKKLLGKTIRNHLWINVLGPQESGKTIWINKLCEPLAGLMWSNVSVEKALDVRLGNCYSQYSIICPDELSRAAKADMEDLKSIITADRVSFRPMQTGRTEQVRNMSSFISSSNHSLSEALGDVTGMRRFFEFSGLSGDRTLIRKWFMSLSVEDIIKVWRCVDESRGEGYIVGSIKEQLEAAQKLLVPQLPLDRWYEQLNKKKWYSNEDLAASSQVFFRFSENTQPPSQQAIGKFLGRKNGCESRLEKVKEEDDGKVIWNTRRGWWVE
jgi:hypothetical protein